MADTLTWQEQEIKRRKDTAAAAERLQRESLNFYNDPVRQPQINPRIGGAIRATWMHGDPYRSDIQRIGKDMGVDPDLIQSLLSIEQQGNMKAGDYSASSRDGAKGLMQITDATAKQFNVNRDDPVDSIRGAAAVLKEMQDRLGTTDPYFLAAAYNAGDRRIREYGQATSDLPQETKDYMATFYFTYQAMKDPNHPRNKR